uniref:Uncharacterized protein n=1 Tax=Candidatus Kentrum sp. FM TaxID=2126340 RepID=A0A450W088_9GAMM|nr:MAG: hypothetical protein BECKFM1743A_GA0114220_101332 [Candidatus Kentron sp. FM]VFK10461.1 MAG: hypothetical protein BECKFM1743B_GA0114221_101412 [Candidatus Kentron sp. FM]
MSLRKKLLDTFGAQVSSDHERYPADVKCLGLLYLYVGRYPRNNASRNSSGRRVLIVSGAGQSDALDCLNYWDLAAPDLLHERTLRLLDMPPARLADLICLFPTRLCKWIEF